MSAVRPIVKADPVCPEHPGKKRYLTWAHASRDARNMRRNKQRGGSNEHPWHCPACSGIHVGGNLGGSNARRPSKRKVR